MSTSVEAADVASEDAASRSPIDFGWVVLGRLDEIDEEAVEAARTEVSSRLSSAFPEFDWRLRLTHRSEPAPALRERPVALLERGIVERDRKAWDFVLVVTGNEIVGTENPYTLGVPSQSVDVAAVSTARIDPSALGEELEREERKRVLVRRLVALVLHLFGHLNGLEHEEDQRSWMAEFSDVPELDLMDRWSETSLEALRKTLGQVADMRLEERPERPGRLRFYLGAVWLNWSGVLSSVASARPWLFPLRVSKFTAAASSALFILLVTAEVWEVGLRQSGALVLLTGAAALAGITVFIVSRQRILLSHGRRGPTEQIAVTNVAVVLSVVIGLLTTFIALFLLTLTVAWLLFPPDVVAGWSSGGGRPGARSYLALAGFVSSLGLLIGALGASFEEQDYLRHVAYVDEEL